MYIPCISLYIYIFNISIYIYIYMCVCVCMCNKADSRKCAKPKRSNQPEMRFRAEGFLSRDKALGLDLGLVTWDQGKNWCKHLAVCSNQQHKGYRHCQAMFCAAGFGFSRKLEYHVSKAALDTHGLFTNKPVSHGLSAMWKQILPHPYTLHRPVRSIVGVCQKGPVSYLTLKPYL